ncbi:hypothetical protein V5799_013985, partial [Amblyomma americanum]
HEELGAILLQGHVPSRKVPRRWIFAPQLPPPPSGRGGFEVGADRLRAKSPAISFRGGGFLLCSCPALAVHDLRSEQVA